MNQETLEILRLCSLLAARTSHAMVTPIGTCRGLINDALEQRSPAREDLTGARDATSSLLGLVASLRYLQVPTTIAPVELSLRDLVEDEVGSWGVPATSIVEPSPKDWVGNLESQVIRRALRSLFAGLKEFALLLGAGPIVSATTHCGTWLAEGENVAKTRGLVTLEVKVENPQIRYPLPSPCSVPSLAESLDSHAVVPFIITELLCRAHCGCCRISYIPDLGFSGRLEIGQLEPLELPNKRQSSGATAQRTKPEA